MKRGAIAIGFVSLILAGAFFDVVRADRFNSTSYVIDGSVTNSAGGTQSSTTYRLTSSTGEVAVGKGTSGSYKMGYGFVSQLEKRISLTAQPSGLVAAYSLDETTGTTVGDDSINKTYGTLQAALSTTTGKVGSAQSFNGTSQAISIGNNAQTQITTGTIEAWVRTTTSTGTLAVVTKANNFWLGLSSGKPAIYDWTSLVTCYDSATTVSDGSWHHLVATLRSGVPNGSLLYVDGVLNKTCTWTPLNQSGAFVIGAVYGGSFAQLFNGSLDNIKIFNRVLTADEVKAEFMAQTAGRRSGLTLGTITPGTSSTTLSDIVVQTDAGGYTLAVSQNNNLTSGAYTIPSVGGSIASPSAWTEGTTKGLGFTLTATNATAISGVWGGGANYAALPSTATSFYTRTGIQSATNDYLTMRLRADVALTQPATGSAYTNIMTVTGTMTP